MSARVWSSGADGGIRRRGRAPAGVRAGFRGCLVVARCLRRRVAPAPGGKRVTPSSIPMPAQSEVDAWVQGAPAVQQPIVVPDRKMSRKARREAERALALAPLPS